MSFKETFELSYYFLKIESVKTPNIAHSMQLLKYLALQILTYKANNKRCFYVVIAFKVQSVKAF